MSWNYRVIQEETDGEKCFGIHEVYYNDKGEITAYTISPVTMTWYNDETPDDLLKKFQRAISSPVLSKSKLNKELEKRALRETKEPVITKGSRLGEK